MTAVFDTNAVASASFWRGAPFNCLMAWAQGRCEAAISPALLAEYYEIIEELSLDYPQQPFVNWVEALTGAAALVFPAERAVGVTGDADDEMVLECALAADADFIVTGDKKHLLPIRQFREILIISPSEFLRQLPK